MDTHDKIWLLPENGKLYKANLHSHSTISDGKFTPEELKEMYLSQGYSAIAYTDHQVCVPHPELTDEDFVALTGIEIAFGIRKATTVHICGIARDPMARLEIPNYPMDDMEKINAGIRQLNESNYITTLNHPRWSGMSATDIMAIGDVANMEVLNGYELVQDGYGDSSACFEFELRRGRKVRPLATDDNHTMTPAGDAGYEYFQGFTVLKAPELSYSALINALDTSAYFASTGPMFKNLWLEKGVLHVECSPVRGVYVHGKRYSHHIAVLQGIDCIETVDIPLEKGFADSDYFFIQIVDTNGKRAWSCPYWMKRNEKGEIIGV